MKFPFHLIINYAQTKPVEMDRALYDFFGSPSENPMEDENIEALFLEWLMYEYKQLSGTTFIAEYTLKNPDRLPQQKIRQFEQIIETNRYSEFEIQVVVPGSHLVVEDVYMSKVYTVYDTLGSMNGKSKGILKARIGHVEGRWHLVGANPIYVPLTYTNRMKDILRRDFGLHGISVRDTAQLLLEHSHHPPEKPPLITKSALKEKRKVLEQAYKEASTLCGVTLLFETLTQAIYEEDRVNVLDFWHSLLKQGLTEEFFVKHLEIVQDIWNYFPHQCLGNHSPVEAYATLSKKNK